MSERKEEGDSRLEDIMLLTEILKDGKRENPVGQNNKRSFIKIFIPVALFFVLCIGMMIAVKNL